MYPWIERSYYETNQAKILGLRPREDGSFNFYNAPCTCDVHSEEAHCTNNFITWREQYFLVNCFIISHFRPRLFLFILYLFTAIYKAVPLRVDGHVSIGMYTLTWSETAHHVLFAASLSLLYLFVFVFFKWPWDHEIFLFVFKEDVGQMDTDTKYQ